MLKRIWIFVGLLCGLAANVSAVRADPAARLFERGRSRYFSGRAVNSTAIKRRELLQAASELQKFLNTYPRHANVTSAHFNLGAIYRDLADLDGDRDQATRALHHFREVVQKFPQSHLADDALFEVSDICGSIFHDQRCKDETAERIRREYPDGDMIARLNGAQSVSPGDTRATLTTVNVNRESEAVTFRIRLTAPRPYTTKSLLADAENQMPPRYYVEISEARLDRELATPTIESDLPVKQVRFGQYTKSSVRVVFDLADPSDASRIQALVAEGGIDVQIPLATRLGVSLAGGTTPQVQSEAVLQPMEEVSPAPTTVPPSVAVRTEKKRPLKIVIDPGHGGEDHGATGKRGTLEKNVTLAISKKLADVLGNQSNYEVYMTRRDDRFIPLNERTKMANAWNGDLFVSIHANASPKRQAGGVSTYFLNNADDEESLRVALRENLGWIADAATSPAEPEDRYLEVMKASMIKNFHTVQSTDLARYVQSGILKELGARYRDVEDLGVRSARFYVLTGAEMPAILVETSFISNPAEEKRLRDDRYQLALSQAIARGIERFFKNAAGSDHAALYRH
ncbi:MAG TPA: N-acetylmuramoyl-L-alanine amidase [Bdellovibrionota bacterium]|nr:N-acetylmuramoyl-L-alanine amidase [Bdellovibrionota bacterium]